MKLLSVLPLLLLVGCSNSDKLTSALNEMQEKCAGRMSVSLTVSSWNKAMTVSCDELKPGAFK